MCGLDSTGLVLFKPLLDQERRIQTELGKQERRKELVGRDHPARRGWFGAATHHSFGGSPLALIPIRRTNGQVTFRVCWESPHAVRSSSIICSNESVPFAAMNR